MKYINQKEYPDWLYVTRVDLDGEEQERGKTTTVASSGCGLCSAIMVADRLLVNPGFDLREALKLSYDVGANREIGTDYEIYAPAFAEKMELEWEGSDDPERLRHCLRTGGAAVANVGGNREGHTGVFSANGHYIVIVSEERDGQLAVMDPSYVEGKYEEDGRQGLVVMKNGVIAICDMQVLVDDTANRTPRFHLFWRK